MALAISVKIEQEFMVGEARLKIRRNKMNPSVLTVVIIADRSVRVDRNPNKQQPPASPEK